MYHRLLHHRCRVRNPKDATAFFIPYDDVADSTGYYGMPPAKQSAATGHLATSYHPTEAASTEGNHCRAGRDLYNAIASATPGSTHYLERHGGRDHFMVHSRVSHFDECYHFEELRPFFDHVIQLDIERLSSNSAKMSGAPVPMALPPRHDVPYPSYFHADLYGTTAPPPWQRATRRPMLAMHSAGEHGDSVKLRHVLTDACKANVLCNFLPIPEEYRDFPPVQLFSSLAKAMLGARYCLQPPGDTPSRKAMVDSVLLGCIPVLFSRRQTTLWPWHWRAAKVSVVLDGDAVEKGTLDVFDELARIPASREGAMRQALQAVAYGMQYNLRDVPGVHDAFDVIMERLAQVMRG